MNDNLYFNTANAINAINAINAPNTNTNRCIEIKTMYMATYGATKNQYDRLSFELCYKLG